MDDKNGNIKPRGLVLFRERTNAKDKKVYIGFSIFFVLCWIAALFPVAEIANKVHPIVFGMYFFFFYEVMLAGFQSIAAFCLFRWEYRKKTMEVKS